MINTDQILSSASAVGRGPVDAVTCGFHAFQAQLESGTSATINIDLSDDGVSWQTYITFTLDNVGQVIESDLVRCDKQFVSVYVSSINGKVSAWKGE